MNVIKYVKSIAAMVASLAMTACCSSNTTEISTDNNKDKLYQVSTIQALMAGDYYGQITVKELLKHGDTGLGTFKNMDGELVLIDGVCYQAKGDGKVNVCAQDTLIPFAGVSFLNNQNSKTYANPISFKELKDDLDAQIKSLGMNYFYVGKITGTFKSIKVRAPLVQQEPFRTLDKVMETDQMFYTYENIKGNLVLEYVPLYAKDINAAGWHLHFISEDRTKGGHVIDFNMNDGELFLDKTTGFEMVLPDTQFFRELDLMGRDEAVRKVEKGE